MNKTLKTLLQVILSLCLGGFFIWVFVRKLTPEEIREIWSGFAKANYWWVSIGIIIGIISHWARAERWKLLIEQMGYKPSSLNMFGAVMVAYLTNIALPRVGEIARCTLLAKQEKIPFSKSFGTVITERVFDIVCFLVFFCINFIFQFSKIKNYVFEKIYAPLVDKMSISAESAGPKILLLVFFIGIGVGLFFLYKKFKHTKIGTKIANTFKGFGDGLKTLIQLKKPFRFIFYTLLMWTCYMFMAYIIFFSLPETAQLPLAAGFAALMFGTIGIAVVQGGIGIYPAIISETLGLWDVPAISGYTLGWLVWSVQQAIIILLGLATLIFLPTHNKNQTHKSTV
ncbi:MAG: lysylphosphatidylglycerol synthase transmembrane domain-containing protein [Bacteroidales bacterium]|nr:lysylphosphatidylglycerol synthase transmembrane domain-containing protein [Bacteroidales bacterium]